MDSLFFRAKPFSRTYFGIPLAIPTLAGLTPPGHEVCIVDEMVERIDFDDGYDLVGISAMTCKATRAYQIAREFRRRGVRVVMGGIHASMCPDEAAQHVDSVAVGEADELWAGILLDAQSGRLKPRYQADGFPELGALPPPRHDLTRHTQYFCFFLQTTRGCPRACNFCTVTTQNGRALRKKSPNQIIAEVQAVVGLPNPLRPVVIDRERDGQKRRVASGAIFFVDDNFAIDRTHALAVCRALKAFQDDNDVHLNWFTQCDVKTGFDDDLLAAMKDAGCMNIFMGFESLQPDALRAFNKKVNVPERYHQCIANVERHGIDVTTSIIIGTDYENARSGDEWARFAETNRVFYMFPNIMTPYPGTELMAEMETEGRILRREPELYNIRNVIFRPKQLAPDELRSMYVELCQRTLGLNRLLKTAIAKLRRPNRYYLTHRWRLFIWLSFSLMFVVLAARRKLSLLQLVRLLLAAPRFLVLDGSLNALGYLVNAVGFGTFAVSERHRLRAAREETVTPATRREVSPSLAHRDRVG